MTIRTVASLRCNGFVYWSTLFGILLATTAAVAQPSCFSGCPSGTTCTQLYGARGMVRDDVTNEPIASATIVVFDLEGVSGADGSYDVSGSRLSTCHFDYLFSMSVSAPGYETFLQEAYFTSAYQAILEIRLRPLGTPITLPPTPTQCPVETPCILGEHPRPCSTEPCGLGCGCESCPPCPEGGVLAPNYNRCDCEFPGASPTPTPTPDRCRFSTPPLCSVGYEVECDLHACPEDCHCVPCEPCLDGLVFNDVPYNQCLCIPPLITPTFTPTPDATGPTATVCPERTQCPSGQHPRPCSEPCGLGCGCEATRPPTQTPTPTSIADPVFCPTATPPSCTDDERLTCDVKRGPCTLCRCAPCAPCDAGFEREAGTSSCSCTAKADVPSDPPSQMSDSGGGCAIATTGGSVAALWPWSLAVLALIRRRFRH